VTPARIVVASQNPDKIREVDAVISSAVPGVEIVRGLQWPEVEETETTLEGNALLKARAVFASTGIASLADDTGLEVDALGGEPGVRTARFAGSDATYEDNVAHLLERMRGVTDRSATFRTVVVLVDDSGVTATAEGRLDGRINDVRRGTGGFGYDPVFEVEGRTLAEMGEDEKNLMSHRARALRALVEAVWGAER
jgi:XTP/dITP diphosphohydrolase